MLFILACKNKSQSTDSNSQASLPAEIQAQYQLIQQYPDSVALQLKLVNALDSFGNSKLAIAQMDTLIKLDSLNFGFWFKKAQLLETAKDTTLALQAYQYAINLFASPDAMLHAANLLAEKKDSLAITISNTVLSQRQGRDYASHAFFIKGIYYARKKDTSNAFIALDNCIKNDYGYAEAYMEKGFIYFDSHQISKAILQFETLANLKPTYADAQYWLGKCLEAIGQKENAVKRYRQALILDPHIQEATTAIERLK